MVSFWTALFFFFPWMCSRGRRFLNLFFHALSLSLFPQLDQTLTSNIPPPYALQSHWREERKPHATLPYAMTGQDRVTPLPLLINMGRYRRIGGSGKKKGEKERGNRGESFWEERKILKKTKMNELRIWGWESKKKQRIERRETYKKKWKRKNREKDFWEELTGNEKNRVGTLKREGKYRGF